MAEDAVTVFRNSRYASIPIRLMLASERRLDGESYLTDGFQYRYRIESRRCCMVRPGKAGQRGVTMR